MQRSEEEFSIIMRHADKGKWTIDEADLRGKLPFDEAELILSVLKEELPGAGETPLKLEGLVRTIKAADVIFEKLPKESLAVLVDSSKERAHLTQALLSARIAQLESKLHGTAQAKRVDMLEVTSSDVRKMLWSASDNTWGPYEEIEKVSEAQALTQWVNAMNDPKRDRPHPDAVEASQNYRSMINKIRDGVTAEKVPVVILGIGHSDSMLQIRLEDELAGREAQEEHSPRFCEMYQFDKDAKLVGVERVEI